MSIVNINSDYSNIDDFINSLFSDGIRTISPINTAISDNKFIAPFSDQNDKISSVLLAAWQEGQGDTYNNTDFSNCPELDKTIINFIANFIKTNSIQMSIPSLDFKNSTSKGVVCKLKSYTSSSFLDSSNKWDYSTVSTFLDLLINGAHFVNIQSSFSLPNGPSVGDLFQEFKSDSSFQEKKDVSGAIGNSHYTSVTNLNGMYYLSIDQDDAPSTDCSFLLSLLFCITSANVVSAKNYESFFQLEGWQLPSTMKSARKSRHSADYDLYNSCYWNISTYGASIYSEKRGTAVFLSPKEWTPIPTEDTYMPPYEGAETAQSWLKTDLITL